MGFITDEMRDAERRRRQMMVDDRSPAEWTMGGELPGTPEEYLEERRQLESELTTCRKELDNLAAGFESEVEAATRRIEELERQLAECQRKLAAAEAKMVEAMKVCDETPEPEYFDGTWTHDMSHRSVNQALDDIHYVLGMENTSAFDAALEAHGLDILQAVAKYIEGVDTWEDFTDATEIESLAMQELAGDLDAALEVAAEERGVGVLVAVHRWLCGEEQNIYIPGPDSEAQERWVDKVREAHQAALEQVRAEEGDSDTD